MADGIIKNNVATISFGTVTEIYYVFGILNGEYVDSRQQASKKVNLM